MDKIEYFKIGENRKLPLRCPILNYCCRRINTIYLNSEYSKFFPNQSITEALFKDGILPTDFEKNKIDIQGELPSIIKGDTYYHFNDMCPEVNLFDPMNSLMRDKACVTGSYDSEYKYEKFKIIKSQHYSECAEFNFSLFKKKNNNSKPRKNIPAKTRSILQKEINSKCPICNNEDVEHFHVHHIDENPTNNNIDNLLMLCPNCHSKITKNDISFEEVVKIKFNLKR
ncbi:MULTISPECIES: HNH endonuclease signature motif containing protein [unclassified Empedobacter]|uniref:HNH endonuclease signature motif containing protein n=1 Tax=unclassified Empedobacter TaxID=2643773 RepID=UPI0025C0CA71|nr:MULTISPECIES: HNH endonuclease signature motif containing protein [unclassified Empedobacter]